MSKRNTKQTAGLTQPTLSFQARRPTANAKGKVTAPARKSASVERSHTPPVTKAKPKEKEHEVIEVPDDTRDELDPNSKEWDALYKEAKGAMGNLPPIHAEKSSKVQDILRVFDLTTKYGPCVGISRLERWERANKWGLNPPAEIKTILLTQQGEDTVELRESVLHDWL